MCFTLPSPKQKLKVLDGVVGKEGGLLVDWPSTVDRNEPKNQLPIGPKFQISMQKLFLQKQRPEAFCPSQVEKQSIVLPTASIDGPARVATEEEKKNQVKFSTQSVLHKYHQVRDTKDLCYSKIERKEIHRDVSRSISRIRDAIADNAEIAVDHEINSPSELVYAACLMNEGIDPEEMIGVEHYVYEGERTNVVADVVREWRRLSIPQDSSNEEHQCDLDAQISALSKKLSKEAGKKARRRAKFVQFMNGTVE